MTKLKNIAIEAVAYLAWGALFTYGLYVAF